MSALTLDNLRQNFQRHRIRRRLQKHLASLSFSAVQVSFAQQFFGSTKPLRPPSHRLHMRQSGRCGFVSGVNREKAAKVLLCNFRVPGRQCSARFALDTCRDFCAIAQHRRVGVRRSITAFSGRFEQRQPFLIATGFHQRLCFAGFLGNLPGTAEQNPNKANRQKSAQEPVQGGVVLPVTMVCWEPRGR